MTAVQEDTFPLYKESITFNFLTFIAGIIAVETANAFAKEILVCKQLLLQHNRTTCCAKLHEIARHIRSRESVLFPPSKEEKNLDIIRPKSALIFSADPLGACFPGQACEH